MTNHAYVAAIARFKAVHGTKFTDSGLDPRFIPFYQTGQRIKVNTMGMEVTGTVTMTTGWRPSFLLMRRSSDHGSMFILDSSTTLLAKQVGKVYRPFSAV